MENNLIVFSKEEFGDVRTIEQNKSSPYVGFFYILEWDNYIKIGCTSNPYQRIITLKHQAEKYGNVIIGRYVLSVPHTNYQENEKLLHKKFDSYRIKGTELFSLNLDIVVKNIPNEIKFLDESDRFERESKAFTESVKDFIVNRGKDDKIINHMQTDSQIATLEVKATLDMVNLLEKEWKLEQGIARDFAIKVLSEHYKVLTPSNVDELKKLLPPAEESNVS
jgi:hypothetical protein|nr:MAG TPA: hypothetical protein [Caudoviricetes sp.]